ncbi:MAG: hypothetical protein JWP01_40 [Myxococcales bacterium]|nr:hypothetical protein [Myxococcales bacterium]
MKAFFVDALTSALDLGIATPEDLLRHVTPDVLAANLPRPLWARLLTACVGASRVDAQLVVETLGVSNLCEHMPAAVIWSCVAEVGQRSLGDAATAAPAIVTRPAAKAAATPLSITSPPAPDPVKTPASPPPAVRGPSIPAPGTSSDTDEDRAPLRARTPTRQPFRATSTGIGRLANTTSSRRPQAQAPAPAPVTLDPTTERPVRRGETVVEAEVEVETPAREDWRNALAVEDEQLVDWSSSEETLTAAGDDPTFRKR